MKIKLIAAVFLLLFTGITVRAQKADFSGNWKLNIEKSKFGNVPAKAAVKTHIIEQKDNELSLTWVTLDAEGKEVTSAQKLKLNGELASFLLPSGKTRTMTVSFAADGKSFALIRKYSKVNKPEEQEYEIKENWTLLADGKELWTEVITPGYSFNAVYNK